MRHRAKQRLSLGERRANQPELVVLQIAQPAVEEFSRGRRRCRREIVHFREHDRKPATRSIAGNATAVDATADDEDIGNRLIVVTGRQALPYLSRLMATIASNARCVNIAARKCSFLIRSRKQWLRDIPAAVSTDSRAVFCVDLLDSPSVLCAISRSHCPPWHQIGPELSTDRNPRTRQKEWPGARRGFDSALRRHRADHPPRPHRAL